MKKIYTFIPALLLAACTQTSGEYQQDEFFYDEDVKSASESELAFENDPFVVNENSGLPDNLELDQDENSQSEKNQIIADSEKTPEATIKVSEDGTRIIIPAQEIYIGNENTVVTASVQTQPTMMAYSQPQSLQADYKNQTQSEQTKQIWITLQNREHTNTFVQCLSTDVSCITLHEQQGYIRVQNLPHFAGYQDIPGASDYPGEGQWRNGNNIPRW